MFAYIKIMKRFLSCICLFQLLSHARTCMICTSKLPSTSLFLDHSNVQIISLLHLYLGAIWISLFLFNRLNVSQLVTLLVDLKLIPILCHMGDFGCGDGGWTPVMKIDGNKVNYISYRILASTCITLLKGFKPTMTAMMYLEQMFITFLTCYVIYWQLW